MNEFKKIFIRKLKKESLIIWILLIFIAVLFDQYTQSKKLAKECFINEIELLKIEIRKLYDDKGK